MVIGSTSGECSKRQRTSNWFEWQMARVTATLTHKSARLNRSRWCFGCGIYRGVLLPLVAQPTANFCCSSGLGQMRIGKWEGWGGIAGGRQDDQRQGLNHAVLVGEPAGKIWRKTQRFVGCSKIK